jgi:hypothetical protein
MLVSQGTSHLRKIFVSVNERKCLAPLAKYTKIALAGSNYYSTSLILLDFIGLKKRAFRGKKMLYFLSLFQVSI